MNTQNLFSLQGRSALITGGSRGIGRMIAAGFLAQGARVYISARKAEACDQAAAELSALGPCVSLPADVSTSEGIGRLVRSYQEHEPALDILVNNAGAAWGAPFDEFPEAGWDKVGIDPLLDDWFREQTPPDLTPQTLWQAMQRGDTPFYQIRLDARAEQGQVRIEQGGASTITHLLALQGGVDLAADQWQLDLGVLNKGRCAELLARWRGPLNAPDLGWSFPTGQDACGWEAGVHYPAQGRSGPLWRPRPPAAQ